MLNPLHLTFDLAGLKVRFVAGDPDWRLVPSARFQNFLSALPADVNLQIGRWNPQDSLSETPTFSARSWAVSRAANQVLVKFNPFPDQSIYPIQAFLLDPDGRGGELWVVQDLPPDTQLSVPPGFLDELLAIYLLARGWGVMLHASGINTAPGRGLIYSGVSGAGKSTTARLWLQAPQTSLLSDERVVVRRLEGKYWVFGTPWNSEGRTTEPGCAPLEALFIIKHAPANQSRRLDPAAALALLMPQVFLAHGDPAGLAFTLEFLGGLLHEVPCYELGFVPDQSAVTYVQNLLG